jgi:hypothetical protein
MTELTLLGCGTRRAATVALGAIFVSMLIAVPHDAGAISASPPQTPVLSSRDTLQMLAAKAGFKNLSECEQTLLQSASIGDYAYCQSDVVSENEPSKGDEWPESHQIRAALIRWLAANEAARKLIDPKGIRVGSSILPLPIPRA